MKMPNWCDNNLYISHEDPEMVKKAVEAWESGNFLATLVPEPDYTVTPVAETFPNITAQYAKTEEEKEKALLNEPTIREDAWWDWRIQNWGTKWDVGYADDRSNHAQVNDNTMFVYFDSAWSPPTGAYEKMLELGYSIRAYYFEGGCSFCGSWIDGSDDCYSIDGDEDGKVSEEHLLKTIPKDILEEMDIIQAYAPWEDE
jgi:hypothetical protein